MVFRHGSVSTSFLVPSDISTSPSLHHVGEGTLEHDSDSSDSESELSSLPSASVLSLTTQPVSHLAHSNGHPPQPALSHCRCWSPDMDRRRARGGRRLAPTRIYRDRIRQRNGAIADTRAFPTPPPTRREMQQSQVPVTPSPTQPAPIAVAMHVQPRPSSRSSMRTVTAHDDGDHEPFLPSAQLTNDSRVTSITMSLSDGLFGSGKKDSHRDSATLDAQDIYVRNSVRRRVEEVGQNFRDTLLHILVFFTLVKENLNSK